MTSFPVHFRSRAPFRQNQKSDKNLECSIFKVVIMSHNYDIRGPNLEFISPDFEFLSGNGIFIFAPYFRKIIIIQKKVISNKMCNYLSFTLFIIYFYLFHIIRIILFNRIIPDNPFSHRFRIRKLSFEYFFGYAWSYF